MSVYMYAYMHIYMYVFLCIYVFLFMHVCMHGCMYVCMVVCIYKYVSVLQERLKFILRTTTTAKTIRMEVKYNLGRPFCLHPSEDHIEKNGETSGSPRIRAERRCAPASIQTPSTPLPFLRRLAYIG